MAGFSQFLDLREKKEKHAVHCFRVFKSSFWCPKWSLLVDEQTVNVGNYLRPQLLLPYLPAAVPESIGELPEVRGGTTNSTGHV